MLLGEVHKLLRLYLTLPVALGNYNKFTAHRSETVLVYYILFNAPRIHKIEDANNKSLPESHYPKFKESQTSNPKNPVHLPIILN